VKRFAFAALLVACAQQQPHASTVAATSSASSSSSAPAPTQGNIPKSTSCKEGELTYLGFRGAGMPPRALYDAVKARFPDVMVYEVKDGTLGVFTAEPHSMDVRKRHEDAAATVPGWKGDVVDFARVEKDCTASFHTPMPPP
jgi:hypothetical protein